MESHSPSAPDVAPGSPPARSGRTARVVVALAMVLLVAVVVIAAAVAVNQRTVASQWRSRAIGQGADASAARAARATERTRVARLEARLADLAHKNAALGDDAAFTAEIRASARSALVALEACGGSTTSCDGAIAQAMGALSNVADSHAHS